MYKIKIFVPPHDKTDKMNVRTAKTQISLSSLCAQWVAKDPNFLHADCKDSDQIGRMLRLTRVFAGRTVILLVLSRGCSFTIDLHQFYFLISDFQIKIRFIQLGFILR